MQRFILSAFSVLLATAAVAPTAQALPKGDPNFNLQALRLSGLDIRNKSEDYSEDYYSKPYYAQPAAEPAPENVSAETESIQTVEPTLWETPESSEEVSDSPLTLIERRNQVLDRS